MAEYVSADLFHISDLCRVLAFQLQRFDVKQH